MDNITLKKYVLKLRKTANTIKKISLELESKEFNKPETPEQVDRRAALWEVGSKLYDLWEKLDDQTDALAITYAVARVRKYGPAVKAFPRDNRVDQLLNLNNLDNR